MYNTLPSETILTINSPLILMLEQKCYLVYWILPRIRDALTTLLSDIVKAFVNENMMF